MSSKKYTLVVWTENGRVRMVPSLVNDAAEPYRQRIARLESLRGEVEDEVGWLLAMSRAYEEFARFLLYFGRTREAFTAFSNAAAVCSLGSHALWVQGDSCDYPTYPLFNRFLAMHRECVRLAQGDRFLALSYEGSQLQWDYEFFTRDRREKEQELDEVAEILRAWRFGKTN